MTAASRSLLQTLSHSILKLKSQSLIILSVQVLGYGRLCRKACDLGWTTSKDHTGQPRVSTGADMRWCSTRCRLLLHHNISVWGLGLKVISFLFEANTKDEQGP